MKRRELFSSLASSFSKEDKQEQKNIIRPPYYGDTSDFLNECQNCDNECLEACEPNIIVIQEDNTPTLNFANSGCTFCDECAKACPSNILKTDYKKNISAKISIDIMQCLSWNQVMCFSCKDPCLDDAIDFIAMFRPEINDNCTSCGFCVNVCPSDAIRVKII